MGNYYMGNTTLFFISHQQGWMKIRRKLGGKEITSAEGMYELLNFRTK